MKDLYKELGIGQLNKNSKGSIVALNTMPWPRREVVSIGNHEVGVAVGEGNVLEVLGVEDLKASEPTVTVQEVKEGVFILENDQLRVKVEGGVVTSLYDRLAEREVIPKGKKANQLVIFDDKPLYWQAWDVEVFHLDSRKELASGSTKIARSGAHYVSVVTETKISEESWIKTYVSLSSAFKGQQSYVEVEAEVEWRESMKFLKVEFPVNVRNTEASYETQFGVVRRPTHYNTT